MQTQIIIGGDHAGYELKEKIKRHITTKGVVIADQGTHSADSTDYPDYAHKVAEKVLSLPGSLGILLCGSANGVCMTANKHKGIRAALCWDPEIAALARQHNDANILCIPARFVSTRKAFKIVDTFLNTTFEGGRHAKRTEKINC